MLFLGEWCRRYDRKHVWESMDAIVARPFGVEPRKKWEDVEHVQSIAARILPQVSAALNGFHQTRYSERYWNIVLGHWLQRYVAVAFNRYHVLEQAIADYRISGSVIVESPDSELASADSAGFITACDSDRWNHAFYASLLKYRGDLELEVARFPIPEPGVQEDSGVKRVVSSSRIKRITRAALGFAGRLLSRSSDAFIMSSYLPPREELKLHAALWQAPQLWGNVAVPSKISRVANRDTLEIDCTAFTGFERYVRWQLPDVIPVCYVEGYAAMVELAEAQPWPAKPKFIFTSNSFDVEECFKLRTASRVEQGIPYFTGQHGNNYGTLRGSQNWPERATADRFISWGWDDGKKVVPAFIFKTAATRPRKFDPAGGLLLIELYLQHRVGPGDVDFEFGLYQEEQFQFVESLPDEIQGEVTVRLHSAHEKTNWFDEQRWRDRNPQIRIEPGQAPIENLIAGSRLLVHSYDSTGLLESLSLNIPSIAFWRGGFAHVLPEAKPFYEQLMQAGVIFGTPGEAAAHVSRNWNDIGAWWQSPSVQRARESFCDRYARTARHPARKLADLLSREAASFRSNSQPLANTARRIDTLSSNQSAIK